MVRAHRENPFLKHSGIDSDQTGGASAHHAFPFGKLASHFYPNGFKET